MPPRLLLNRTLVAIGGWAGALALTLSLTACSPSSTSKSTPASTQPATPHVSAHARALAKQEQIAAYSQQLDAIPPPAKTRYMAISSSARWQNPFLTIHQNSVELRIPAPPAPRTTRRGHRYARRPAPLWKTTKLTLDALPAALAALPESNWPYGRVIAYQDDLNGSPSARVKVRRNEEKTLNLLNDLGVVSYEWPRNRH